jgi:hypothetical protein
MASTQSTPPLHWYPDRTTRPGRRWRLESTLGALTVGHSKTPSRSTRVIRGEPPFVKSMYHFDCKMPPVGFTIP